MPQIFRLFPKSRVVSFPSNYYIPTISQLGVTYKQTSYSRMSTEMICNLKFLNHQESKNMIMSESNQQQMMGPNDPNPKQKAPNYNSHSH